MSIAPKRDGAGVHARTRTPSIQLHRLVERLTHAIAPATGAAADEQAFPLVAYDGSRLIVNPRSVLMRLIADGEFLEAYTPSENSGFVCDIDLPPIGTTAKVGGRLLPGSEAATSAAIDHLQEVIGAALERAIDGKDLGAMCFDSTRAGLERIANSVQEKVAPPPPTAKLVPVAFAREPRAADTRAKDIARVFTAIETINGADEFEAFLQNIATRLRRDDVDEDQLDAIDATIRTQRQLPGSQLGMFLDFLDDEALSRVRLQVSMRIMQAVAEHGAPPLKSYVDRVRAAYEAFASANGEALLLDGSADYGINGRTDLAEQLRKAMFYTCLPVWAEWAAQLYESRMNPGGGFKTVREVSYRFRVNGMSPQDGEMKHSFDNRLDRLQAVFDADSGDKSHPRLPRDLAQLVFLYLVTPSGTGEPVDDVRVIAGHIAEDLRANPKATIDTLFQELRKRSSVMQDLANDLITILQKSSKRILETAAKEIDSFTVAVHKGVVNWEAVTSMSAPGTEILVRPERGDPKTAWFEHLTIANSRAVPGSIVSYSVETRLTERSLAPAGEPSDLPMSRPLDDAHLPIRLVPYRKRKSEGDWVPESLQPDAFDAGRGIDVQYDARLLTLSRKDQDRDKERKEHLRAAAATAFLIVVYAVLWEVLRRVRATQGERPLAATLMRLQLAGKEAKDDEGSAAVYAVSQALEKALARELPIKLQGFVSSAEKGDTLRWRRRGAVQALSGGQPLVFPLAGSLDKVALVNYVTRPCDTHPMRVDAAGFLFVSRTYQAQRLGDQGILKLDRMQSRYVENRKGFDTPQLILEELARLGKLGFEHVMLLSHHFGNRHIGRAAERHAPHSTREFLDGALARYPSMNVYTLRRDVFPAFRLRQRQSGESGFEVTQFADHQAMYQDHQAIDTRAHMPIYTFATLVTPDERGRPQSGFCTYFFDVEERISDVQMAEQVRQNVLGVGAGAPVRTSLVSVLRAIHFLESEKPSDKNVWLPVLDPFSWMTPTSSREAGELTIMSRRSRGEVLLSFPALLSHVTKVLHKERG
jgi:hypothetical protein